MVRKIVHPGVTQRAAKLGVDRTTLLWREDPRYRVMHLKACRKWYRKNRSRQLELMTAWSVKHQGRVICKVCRKKYKDLKSHLQRWDDAPHRSELLRLYGETGKRVIV